MADPNSHIGLVKAIKIVAGTVLAFLAWLHLQWFSGAAGPRPPARFPKFPEDPMVRGIEIGKYVAAVLILHWFIYKLLIPTSLLSKDQRRDLIKNAVNRYARGASHGIVALGYIFVAADAIALWMGDFPIDSLQGLFLIILGTFFQVRAVILNLTEIAPVRPRDQPETAAALPPGVDS